MAKTRSFEATGTMVDMRLLTREDGTGHVLLAMDGEVFVLAKPEAFRLAECLQELARELKSGDVVDYCAKCGEEMPCEEHLEEVRDHGVARKGSRK